MIAFTPLEIFRLDADARMRHARYVYLPTFVDAAFFATFMPNAV